MTLVKTLGDNNPIVRAEFKHQRFVIERGRVGWVWIALAALLVVPSLVASLGYIGAILLDYQAYEFLNNWQSNITLMLVVANMSMYPVVTLMTIGLARNSISREKDKHTWGILRLTNIQNRQLIDGKWWASLWALNGDHGMVNLLRVGLLATYLVTAMPVLHAQNLGIIAPYRLYFLIFMPLFIIHGLLDAALSAIIGIIAAIPDEEWGTVATFTAMTVRLVLVVVTLYALWWIVATLHVNPVLAIMVMVSMIGVITALFVITLWASYRLIERV